MLMTGILVFAATTVNAHEMNTTIGLGADYTDNVLLSSAKQDDILLRPSLSIDYNLDFSQFDANLTYLARHTRYTEESFVNRTDYIGQGSAVWSLFNERLTWDFFQNNNRLVVDQAAERTPENETNRSAFRTGPRLQFRSGANGLLSLGANYSQTTFNNLDNADTANASGSFYYQLGLGATNTVGLAANYSEVTYEQEAFDYDNTRVSVRFTGNGRNLQYDLNIGQNIVARAFGEDIDGMFLQFTSTYTAQDFSVRLGANRELTDSSSGLVLSEGPGDNLNNGDGNFNAPDVVERDRAELAFSYQLVPDKSNTSLTFIWDSQDFKRFPTDTQWLGAIFLLNYQPSRRSTIEYQFNWQDQEFQQPFGLDSELSTDRTHRVTLTYTPNSGHTFTLWSAHYQRDSTILNQNFKEISGGIRWEWLI